MTVDMYAKIEGIPGESTDDAHADWCTIHSFSIGVTQPVSGPSSTGGRTGGRADWSDFSVVKTMDKASPDLMIYCASGKHISQVKIDFCLATEDKHTFTTYTFKDVIVTSVAPGANSNGSDSRPVEQVSFAYGAVEVEYTPIDDTGAAGSSIKRGWSLETNKKV